MDDPEGTPRKEDLLRISQPGPPDDDSGAAGMGVSSERVGHTGPGQRATDGTKDTSRLTAEDLPEDTPPEQAPGAVEANPDGLPPKAGYSSVDPRSDDEPPQHDGGTLRRPQD